MARYHLIRIRPNGTEDLQLGDDDRTVIVDLGEKMAAQFPMERFKIFERAPSGQSIARRVVWPYVSSWGIE